MGPTILLIEWMGIKTALGPTIKNSNQERNTMSLTKSRQFPQPIPIGFYSIRLDPSVWDPQMFSSQGDKSGEL